MHLYIYFRHGAAAELSCATDCIFRLYAFAWLIPQTPHRKKSATSSQQIDDGTVPPRNPTQPHNTEMFPNPALAPNALGEYENENLRHWTLQCLEGLEKDRRIDTCRQDHVQSSLLSAFDVSHWWRIRIWFNAGLHSLLDAFLAKPPRSGFKFASYATDFEASCCGGSV